jgi:RNA 3'-terminal phosphate cyclase
VHARLVTEGSVLGVGVLGQPRKPAERVGAEAAARLHDEWSSGAAVDRWLADQLVPYLGLLGGAIRTSAITEHTATGLRIVDVDER